MLQIIVRDNDRFSAPEQAQMAIEGGAQWVEYSPAPDADAAEERETLSALAALCRECGVILTVVGSPRAAREHGLHGALMPSPTAAATAREELGPEAMLGAVIEDGDEAVTLERADIDYAACPLDAPAERVRAICARARASGAALPIVARGDYALDSLPSLFEAGASAVAMGTSVTAAADPEAATRQAIALIDSIKPQA